MATSHARHDTIDLPLDRTTRAFVARLEADEAPPLDHLTLDQARAGLPALQRLAALEPPDADLRDLALPVGPTGYVQVRIVRPPQRSGMLPGVVYGHGGGWVFGDRHTHDRLIRSLAVAADAAIVFVDYTRAPEARHPVQNEQAYAVLGWLADHGAGIGVDPERLSVAGDSSGANMATVVALLAKRRGGPQLAAQVLFFPTTDAAFDTPSYVRYADGPYLDRAAMQWFWDHYVPDHARRPTPRRRHCAPRSMTSPVYRPRSSSRPSTTRCATKANSMPAGSPTRASTSLPSDTSAQFTPSSSSTPSPIPPPPAAPSRKRAASCPPPSRVPSN